MLTLLADLTVPGAVSLGVSAAALIRLALAFADADLAYFDPRPAVRQGLVHAGHDLNRAIATAERLAGQAARETALTVAALLILTIPTGNRS
jgi:hypothetical protein